MSSETLLVGCLAQDLKGRINEANLIDEGERIKVQVVSTQQVSSTKAVVSKCRPYRRNRSYQRKRPYRSAGRIDAASFIDGGRRIKVQVVSTKQVLSTKADLLKCRSYRRVMRENSTNIPRLGPWSTCGAIGCEKL